MSPASGSTNRKIKIVPLTPEHLETAVDVICDAFAGYPVMRYVLAEEGDRLEELARDLTHYFVAARLLRSEPALGLLEDGEMVAAATITPPHESDAPAELDRLREATWERLGARAKARYDELVVHWQAFSVDRPNYHVNMLGVRQSHAGRGYGRRLMDAIHHMSEVDPDSAGVTLTTEVPKNVPFYEHFGYEIVGQFEIGRHIRSWGFFRPDDRAETSAGGASTRDSNSPQANKIIALEEAMAAAICANDARAVGPYLHEDWILAGEGGSILSRADFLAAIESGALVHTQMELEGWRVRLYDGTAVATCAARSGGTYRGEPFQTHERSTSVYSKFGGAWRCVLTQLTPMAEG